MSYAYHFQVRFRIQLFFSFCDKRAMHEINLVIELMFQRVIELGIVN